MDKKFLKDVLDETVERFDYMNNGQEHDEGFKFTAIATFQREWNVEAEDFLAMFQRATKDALPLLESQKNLPNTGLIKLMELGEVEFVRSLFQSLFIDDGGDLRLRQNRLADFVEHVNLKLKETSLKGTLYKLNLYSALSYLNLWRPQENFFIKNTEARTWCLTMNYSPDIGTGSKFSLERYYEMCHRFLQEIRQCKPLMELNAARAKAKGCTDQLVAEHVLMHDVIHGASAYIFSDRMGLDLSKKDRIRETKEIYMEKKEIKDQKKELAELEEQPLLDWQLLVGKPINSKRFGEGVIRKIEGTTITAAFGEMVKYFDLKTCLRVNLLGLEQECFDRYHKDLEIREEKKDLLRKMED